MEKVERLDHRQRGRSFVQSLIVAIVTPLLITSFIGLLLDAFDISFDFKPSLIVVAAVVIASVAGGALDKVARWIAVVVVVVVAVANADSVIGRVAIFVVVVCTFALASSERRQAEEDELVSLVFPVRNHPARNQLVWKDIIPGIPIRPMSFTTHAVFGGAIFGILRGVARGLLWGAERSVVRVAVDMAGGDPAFGWFFVIFILLLIFLSIFLSIALFLKCCFGTFSFLGEMLTTLLSLWRAKGQPEQAAWLLQQSLAYRDETLPLPQPFLSRLLVIVGEQDKKAARNAIIHLVTNTRQRRVAEHALLELEGREMLNCHTVEEIAQRGATGYWLSSIDTSKRLRQATEALAQCQKASNEISAAVSATSNYSKLDAFNRARRQLEELSKFAVLGLRGRESRIFAQIAQQWLGIVNAEIDRLTEEERVSERIPNPYIPLNALLSGSEVFFGRADAYNFIEEHFLRADQKTTIVLYGQRRIGKSSILRNLNVRLTTNLVPVYVDMQRSPAQTTSGWLFNLADAISRALTERGIHLKQPALSDYATEPFIVFGKFLDEVEENIHAPENRLILALDEFEAIDQKLAEGRVSKDLLPFLRNLMQHRQSVSLIFAGTHTLDEMISGDWIQYFNTAVPCRVSYLDEASARKLITQPIDDFPLNYEPEAVDLLIEQTRCHPCLIQLTCQALVDMKNEQRSRHATVEDVEQALKKTLHNDYALHSVWDWVPESERPLLAWLASAESASIEQMVRALGKPAAEARGMAEHLTKAEILMREDGKAVYRFQVPLFRRWVARHAALTGMEFDQRQMAMK
jgi:hypothetical protein